MPWGNCGSGTTRSLAGVVAVSQAGASRCVATRAARCRSIHACREHWPELRRRHGTEGPTTSSWEGAGASAPGVTGDWSWPGQPPRVKLIAVGDAHEVVVPRGLKVQASEPDFESGWEEVRAAHGIPLALVLGADHHRDGLWKLIFSAQFPYLARQLSVRKVVPTLTSKSAEIYISMGGAKQLGDTGFILAPAGAVRPAAVCSRHCIALHRGACRRGLQARRERRSGLQVLEVFFIEASANIVVKAESVRASATRRPPLRPGDCPSFYRPRRR
jgi:hypothetical protein